MERTNFEIIAHRGVHQDSGDTKGLRFGTSWVNACSATSIKPPTHRYLENTVESIQAAFDYGATIVEIDIRPTKDNHLVVFHDWMLDCRTDAHGRVIDCRVEYLKTLDIGYGYTYDGETYPFRGTGVGKIQTLKEILTKFPDKKFLIDNKSGTDFAVAKLIVDTLSQFPEEQQKLLYIWCDDEVYEFIHNDIPFIERLILPRYRLKRFYKSYITKLGFYRIPEEYRGQGIGLTTNYTKYIWGWPNRFLQKIYKADMKFYLYANTIEEAKRYSNIPINGVVTDRIEILGEYYNQIKNKPST